MSFPPATEMFQFAGFASLTYLFSQGYPRGWVAPFGDPGINDRSHLPRAFRSVPRPSSPLSAKASTRCPSHPRPAPATTAPRRPLANRFAQSPHTGPSQEPADEQQPTSGRPPHPKVPKAAIKSIPMPKTARAQDGKTGSPHGQGPRRQPTTGARLLASARSRTPGIPSIPSPRTSSHHHFTMSKEHPQHQSTAADGSPVAPLPDKHPKERPRQSIETAHPH